MAYFVTEGATLKCSFGDKASTLKVPQPHGSFIEGKAQATVIDFIPMFNIQPFGKCSCLANPTVAAATAAKNGTLTPMPCIPMLNRMWSFGKSNLKIMGSRALLDISANQCMYGGVIKIEDPNVISVSEGAKLKEVKFVTLEKIGIIKESKAASESEGAEGTGEAGDDFVGTLKGQLVQLPGVKTEKINYTKRNPVETESLRKEFDSTERKKFLQGLAEDPERLKKAGLSDADIVRMKDGLNPKGWQVHHKLPLDDGGTNAMDNLVLINNSPYHKAITNFQNASTKGMFPGETKILEWPIPKGNIYPPGK